MPGSLWQWVYLGKCIAKVVTLIAIKFYALLNAAE